MKKILYLFLLIMISANSFSQTSNNLTLPERLQYVLNKSAASKSIKGMTASVKLKDGTLWKGTYGYSHGTVKIDTGTLFGIGSITKHFTTVVIMQLLEESKLSLKDSIHKYLKKYQNIDSTITIEQLLNHTSGIYNYTNNNNLFLVAITNPSKIWAPEDLLKYVLTPSFTAGSNWEYSNTNYVLLGMIIEKITGESYAANVRKRILNVLNMKSTFVFPYESLTGTISHVYSYSNGSHTDNSTLNNSNATFSIAYSAGCIVSNSGDLVKFFQGLNTGKLITKSSRNLMQAGSSKAAYYGLGTMIKSQNKNKAQTMIFGHDGSIGFSSSGYFYTVDTLSIAVVLNQDTDPYSFTQNLYSAYYNEAPTDITISNNVIQDNTPDNTEVASLSTLDANEHGTYAYGFISNASVNDNDCFKIQNNKLLTKCNISYSLKSEYKIELKSEDGFGGDVIKSFTLAVTKPNNLASDEVLTASIFPNPAKDYINIKLENSNQQMIKIKLQGLDGRTFLVKEFNSEEFKLDIKGIKSGIYFLSVVQNNQEIIKKIAIE